ncbi:MAG: ATP-binding protein [Thermoguttaceae bacterium]
MRSLRAALVLGTTAGSSAILLAAGVSLYLLVRASLVEQLDLALIDKARLLASAVEVGRKGAALEVDPASLRDSGPSDAPAYYQLWAADGRVLLRSPSLGSADLQRIEAPIQAPERRWLVLPDGHTGRAIGLTFRPQVEREQEGKHGGPEMPPSRSAGRLTLVLARDFAPLQAMLTRLKLFLALVGVASVAASAAVLLLVVRRSLRPLDLLAAMIARIGEDELGARIRLARTPRELLPVTDRLNDLLERLQAAFDRERSFSADVAHELRSPLAGLRSTIDVALSRTRPATEYQEALHDCLRITCQMQGLVENLILLARLEAGQLQPRWQSVSLNALIQDQWNPLAPLAEAKGLNVKWALGPEQPLVTDAAHCALAIRNVLENAVAHANQAGCVRILTRADQRGAAVVVANTGSRLSQDQLPNAFKRFWRGDAARGDTGVHCGLGLALTRKIILLLGGSVEVKSSVNSKFEITLSVPSHQPPPETRNR